MCHSGSPRLHVRPHVTMQHSQTGTAGRARVAIRQGRKVRKCLILRYSFVSAATPTWQVWAGPAQARCAKVLSITGDAVMRSHVHALTIIWMEHAKWQTS